MNFKRILRGPLVWILAALAAMFIGFSLNGGSATYEKVDTSYGLSLLKSGEVSKAVVFDGEQRVDLTLATADAKYKTKNLQFFFASSRGTAVTQAIAEAKLSKGYNDSDPSSPWYVALLGSILPFIFIGLIFWFVLSRGSGGGGGVMNFGKSRAKLVSKETSNVTFADVAGVDEAIEELEEIKDFLKHPEKFLAVGAKIPRGVLLYGPPGTGKTLVAKAVAGEAGVPFFSISGSDFVEMFVGVGASRVRDLFTQAKASAPAIIFVDEIDAVGRQRGTGIGGGNDEREQTLNQLLVEMDGFDTRTNVILIAATNRPDVLDPALLRPGRFDRQIGVGAPDLKGREQILAVHAKGKPMGKDVDLALVARRTPGFTGADLANVLNEAALLTARQDEKEITASTIDEAIDRVIGGPQKKSRLMQDQERLNTAYHEAGHALVAAALNHSDPVTKITILPRGRALVTPWSCRSKTATQSAATSSSTRSPGRWVAALPKRSSSTTQPPAPRTTSRRQPTLPARWSRSTVSHRSSVRSRLPMAARSSSAATWAPPANTARQPRRLSTLRSARFSTTPRTRLTRHST